MPPKKLRVFRAPRTDAYAGGTKRGGVLVAAIAVTALLALIHLALVALTTFVLLRRGGRAEQHLAFDAAGAVAACAFYTWAAAGFCTRKASAITWTLRVNVILAALAVVTFAEGWSQTERALRALEQIDPVAWVKLGFPAVMIVLYLFGAVLALQARGTTLDADDDGEP